MGPTFFWDYWWLRYDQPSSKDLFRPKQASPGVKLVSPGRQTCNLLRPGLSQFKDINPPPPHTAFLISHQIYTDLSDDQKSAKKTRNSADPWTISLPEFLVCTGTLRYTY